MYEAFIVTLDHKLNFLTFFIIAIFSSLSSKSCNSFFLEVITIGALILCGIIVFVIYDRVVIGVKNMVLQHGLYFLVCKSCLCFVEGVFEALFPITPPCQLIGQQDGA